MLKLLKTLCLSVLIIGLILFATFQQKLPSVQCNSEKDASVMIDKIKNLTHNKHVYFELYNKQKEKIATIYDQTDLSPRILKQLVKNQLIIVSRAVLPTPQTALPMPSDL